MISEEEIISSLKDSGMENMLIDEFISSMYMGHLKKSKRLLIEQRERLLTDIHDRQNKMYCLDFLTRKLDQSGVFEKENKGGYHDDLK